MVTVEQGYLQNSPLQGFTAAMMRKTTLTPSRAVRNPNFTVAYVPPRAKIPTLSVNVAAAVPYSSSQPISPVPMNRRQFVTSSAGALAASSSLGSAVAQEATVAETPSAKNDPNKKISLDKGAVLLFQGDSITDAGRNRKTQEIANDASALGRGYVNEIANSLLEEHGDLELQIYNRGISGNKVPDLSYRWQTDTLALKPTVLSILIGVNDLWHKLTDRYDGTAQDYRDGFSALLQRTQETLPDLDLVICEPFVLRCGSVTDSWFPEFEERRAFARVVAEEAGALWVPFQEAFDEAVKAGTTPGHWAGDGVHPTPDGHALMAKTWRKTTGI